jgi:D-aspartate ligase
MAVGKRPIWTAAPDLRIPGPGEALNAKERAKHQLFRGGSDSGLDTARRPGEEKLALQVHHATEMSVLAATGVVLLGGAHGALSVARSFGRNRVPVLLLTDDHPLPKLSRYVSRSFDWPGALSPHAGQWLIDFAVRHDLQGWLLIPCADAEVKCVAEHLDALRSVFKIVSCDWEGLQKLSDKRRLAETARAAGIGFPRNYQVRSAHDAERIEVQFPVVLKPAMRLQRNAFTSAKAFRANARDELQQRYHDAAALVGQDEVVVQELVPGDGESQFSYAALWYGNAPVAEMTARRMRQFPIEFGHTSTFVEVIENDAVKVSARKLLSLVGFEGLVEIEFKRDARDGSYKVLDVNPRPWTWFALCEAAGLDLPILMRNIVLGIAITPAPPSLVQPILGRVWVHFPKDVIVAARLIFRGKLNLVAYIRQVGRKLTFAAFEWDDPLPGILELPLTLYRVVCRTIASRGAARSGPCQDDADTIKADRGRKVKTC